MPEKGKLDDPKSLNRESALGPDGYPEYLFVLFWTLIKDDIIKMLSEFQFGYHRFERIKQALLHLFPKIHGAQDISDFRPIAIPNALYLLSAKLLFNRLVPILSQIISDS